MKIKACLSLMLILAISACKKQVEKERPEFIGHWHAKIGNYNCVRLDIDELSNATYTIYWEGHTTTYEGTARANDNTFKIGRTKTFTIKEYPHKIDTTTEREYSNYHEDGLPKLANWKMVLYGMKPSIFHVCENLEFYKADY